MRSLTLSITAMLVFAATASLAQNKVMPGDNIKSCKKGDCDVIVDKYQLAKDATKVIVKQSADEVAVLVGDSVAIDVRKDVLRMISADDRVAFELPAAGVSAPIVIGGGQSTAL